MNQIEINEISSELKTSDIERIISSMKESENKDWRQLQDILLKEFPLSPVFIIHGYDNFSSEAYIQDAYFNREVAQRVMRGIPPNGSLPDSYRIEATNPTEIRKKDFLSCEMIYMFLSNNLNLSNQEK